MKQGTWFPYFLIGLLLLSVGANVYLIIRAVNDPSFAVEPDYYAKAVAWDQLQEERAESEALGWTITVEPGHDALRIGLRDALNRPIDGAEVSVEAFPNARAQERLVGVMLPKGHGVYVLERPFDRRGVWEYRFTAVLRDQKFLHVAQAELP